jgi:hypothetical protein
MRAKIDDLRRQQEQHWELDRCDRPNELLRRQSPAHAWRVSQRTTAQGAKLAQ